MWIIFALLAAFFAGITTIFSKIGVNNVDSTLATSLRTAIILIFNLLVVFFIGSFNEINKLDLKIIIFLILSGITTALLWLSYFKALQLCDVNKVTPIDKTSIVLTLLLSSLFLNEKITIIKIISMVVILIETFLMIKRQKNQCDNKCFIYAILTAVFTSLATI